MAQHIVISVTLIVVIIWFLTGNFGATASIFSVKNYSLVEGKEKQQALEKIHEILRNQK